jgi:hypothetical protein
LAIWAVVALGVGLRVRQWWYGRAFWLDELLLIRAMSEQKIGEVLTPLNLAQSAPPGWLAVEHVLIGLAPGERGARLLPLLFGVGALVLTALLARTLLGGPAALVATAIAAFSTRLIQYSSELKQYSADGFWLQLVLLLGVRAAAPRRGTGTSSPRWPRWRSGSATPPRSRSAGSSWSSASRRWPVDSGGSCWCWSAARCRSRPGSASSTPRCCRRTRPTRR